MTKVAVLTIMYENGDERNSAYIVGTQCFYINDCLSDKVAGVLTGYMGATDYDIDWSCLDRVDNWLSNSDDEVLSVGDCLTAILDVVTIL